MLGVLADAADNNVMSPDFKPPDFEIRNLYADEFRYYHPAVKSDNFTKINELCQIIYRICLKILCTHYTVSVSENSKFIW